MWWGLADPKPLSCGLRGSCKAARLGYGFPASEPVSLLLQCLPAALASAVDTVFQSVCRPFTGAPRPRLPDDIVRRIDEILRAPEREKRARFFWQQGPCYLSRKLWAAAEAGAPKDVRALLRLGATDGREDIAYTDEGYRHVYKSGGMAMRAAIERGDVRIVEALLEADASWGPLASRGEVLCRAALLGNVAICALALRHGADVNCDNGKALGWAVQGSSVETVAFLIDRGATCSNSLTSWLRLGLEPYSSLSEEKRRRTELFLLLLEKCGRRV